MSKEHSAEWLRGALAGLKELASFAESLPVSEVERQELLRHYAALLAAEAREAGKGALTTKRVITVNGVAVHRQGQDSSAAQPTECKACIGTGNFYGRDEDDDFLRCDECQGTGELASISTQPTAAEVIAGAKAELQAAMDNFDGAEGADIHTVTASYVALFQTIEHVKDNLTAWEVAQR